MPTNVTPEYREAEARYRAATTPEDKLEALEEMLRIMPKHKGTDRLQADVKTRIAKLRRQSEKKGGARHSHAVPREGAGQVALVGAPNCGKSSLVAALTHADPKVAAYPFTTREPTPGMMRFEDVAIQLIDLPPLSREHVDPWVFDMVRRADVVWLTAAQANSYDELEQTLAMLEEKKIRLHPPGSPPEEELRGWTLRPTLLVLTGADAPDCDENIEILAELMELPWPRFAVSAVDGAGSDPLGRATFEALEVIRIYTKEPSKPPDREKPFTLDRGATVGDLARTIHKEFAEHLKFARMWGSSVFDGQQVQADHALQEGDVVELHLT